MTSEMSIDLTDNPALKDLFTSWKVGETYEPKLRMQFNSMDGNTAKVSVDRWTIEGDDDTDEGEDKVIETDMKHPVAVVFGMAKNGSKGQESKSKSSEKAQSY